MSPELLEGAHGQRALLAPRTTEPPKAPVGAHEHDVEDRRGEVPVHARPLGDVGHQAAPSGGVLAQHADATRDPRNHPERRLEQRALPGTVRADDGGEGPSNQAHVGIPERRLVAVGDREALHVERELLRGVLTRAALNHDVPSAAEMTSTLARKAPRKVFTGGSTPRSSE